MLFEDEFLDTNTTCYEIMQLRRTMKYIVDDIYTGTYDVDDLDKTIPMLMGLADMINSLQVVI